jgi:HlyD family secretion protein
MPPEKDTAPASAPIHPPANKKIIRAVAGLAIAAALLMAWYFTREQKDSDTLVLYGNVDIRQVSLAFNGSERVADMRVQEGDRVKAGQVLATLDTRTLTLQIEQAEARIDVQEQALLRLKNGTRPEEVAQARAQVIAAQADADFASQQFARLQNIEQTSGQAVSQQDLDNARSRARAALAQLENQKKALQLAVIGPRQEDIAQAEAELQVSQSDLALLRHQLSLYELTAPIDAIVRSRLLEPGDMASPQRAVYALAITDPKWVRAYVSEVDLGRIKPGMSASVTTDSHPAEPVRGRVGFISSMAEFTPKTVQTEELRTSLVYEVRIFVEDASNRLRLGMPATVRIALQGNAGSPEPSADE